MKQETKQAYLFCVAFGIENDKTKSATFASAFVVHDEAVNHPAMRLKVALQLCGSDI